MISKTQTAAKTTAAEPKPTTAEEVFTREALELLSGFDYGIVDRLGITNKPDDFTESERASVMAAIRVPFSKAYDVAKEAVRTLKDLGLLREAIDEVSEADAKLGFDWKWEIADKPEVRP